MTTLTLSLNVMELEESGEQWREHIEMPQAVKNDDGPAQPMTFFAPAEAG